MSAKTIKSALGLLQDDPDSTQTWQKLREEVETDPGMSPDELGKLLESARRVYEGRREYEAVQKLLEIELLAARGTSRERGLLGELARVLDEELMDDAGARDAYQRLLAGDPNDTDAAEVLERTNAKRSKWRELASRCSHLEMAPSCRSEETVSLDTARSRRSGRRMRRRRTRRWHRDKRCRIS